MAVGTSRDDNLNLDEIIISPEFGQSLEDLTRDHGRNSIVIDRMLARLKKLDIGFSSLLEESPIGFIWTEFTPVMKYKIAGSVDAADMEDFIAYTSNGVYGVAQISELYSFVWIKGSINCTGAPSFSEVVGDHAAADAYVYVELPHPFYNATREIVGNLTCSRVELVGATPTIFYGFVPIIDGSAEDEVKSMLQLQATYDALEIGLFPTGFISGSKVHFDVLYIAPTDLEYLQVPADPPPEPPTEGMIAWYDPSDVETLFQDTGATTPVTATNDIVRGVLDKSGVGNHLNAASITGTCVWNDAGYVEYTSSVLSRASSSNINSKQIITRISAWGDSSGNVTGSIIELDGSPVFLECSRGTLNVTVPNTQSFVFSAGTLITAGLMHVLVERFDGTQVAASRAYSRFNNTEYVITSAPASPQTAMPATAIQIRELGRISNNGSFNSSGKWFGTLIYEGDTFDMDQAIEYMLYQLGIDALPQEDLTFVDAVYSQTASTVALGAAIAKTKSRQQLGITMKVASGQTVSFSKTLTSLTSVTMSGTNITTTISMRSYGIADDIETVNATSSSSFGWLAAIFETAGFFRSIQPNSHAPGAGVTSVTVPSITAEQAGLCIRVFTQISGSAGQLPSISSITASGFTTIYSHIEEFENTSDNPPGDPVDDTRISLVVITKFVTAGEVIPACTITWDMATNTSGLGCILC